MASFRQFIVIEGIDGVGKTTAARHLAERSCSVLHHTPAGLWKKYRHLADRCIPCIRCIYYTTATIFSSIKISKMIRSTSVVCDRYIFSTWAYHVVSDSFVSRLVLIIAPFLKQPDYVFYLYVSPESRKERLNSRNDNTASDYDENLQRKVHSNYMSLKNIIPLDTTDMDSDEVAAVILQVTCMNREAISDNSLKNI